MTEITDVLTPQSLRVALQNVTVRHIERQRPARCLMGVFLGLYEQM